MLIRNPAYTDTVIAEIKKRFAAERSVQLQSLLSAESYESLTKIILTQETKEWRVPDEAWFQRITGKKALLPELIQLLQQITGRKIKTQEWRLFLPHHYTLRKDHDENEKKKDEKQNQQMKKGKIFALLDLASLDESWGGYTSVVGDAGEVIRIIPQANTLSIITIAHDQDHFVKYVNCTAASPRVLWIAELG